MVRLGALLLRVSSFGLVAAACTTARTGELEPRYVAVHNTLAAMGLVQVGPIQQGSLAEGRETRFGIDLAAQCTTILAIGGPGVRDLEVALLDPDAKPVTHDTTTAPQATLRTCPASGGRYTLVVKMAAGAGDFLAATWAGGVATSPVSSAPAPATLEAHGTCESPLTLAPGLTMSNTRRGDADHAGGCASSDSKELVYKLEVLRRQRVSIEVDAQFDSVLYVRRDECTESEAEVACNDDATPAGTKHGGSTSRGSRLDEVLEPGTYFVFVDGYGSDAGPFRMNVQFADVPTLSDACRQTSPLGTSKLTGTLAGSFDNAHASCGEDAKGPDAIHRLTLGVRARVRLTEHSSDFSPVLHVRRQCTDERSELACTDTGMRTDEAAWAGVLDAGAYAVFADSSDKDARGRYTVEMESSPEAGGGVRGDSCGDALALALSEPAVEGDTFHAHDDVAGRCGGQAAADVVYRFELTRRSRVTAQFSDQEGSHTFVVMQSCADRASEVACGAVVDEMLAPGVYYLAVDGASPEALGRFKFAFAARDVTAQENACKAPPTLVNGQAVAGTTVNAGNKFTNSCGGREDLQSSSDRLYKFTLAARSRVKVTLATPAWDGVLAIRKSCLDAHQSKGARSHEASCNNDFLDKQHAKIETTLEAGTYFVVVDGHQAKNEGPYTLEYRILK